MNDKNAPTFIALCQSCHESSSKDIVALFRELQLLREYYKASEAAWEDVIDVWASDDDGRALHERYRLAQEAVEKGCAE